MGIGRWLADHAETVNKWANSIGQVAVVTSLIVGGIWTYRLFVKKDVPSLEYRGQLTADIKWYGSREKDLCWANLTTTLKNEGVSTFDVTNILIRGWYYSIKTSPTNNGTDLLAPKVRQPTLVDDRLLMSRDPDLSRAYDKENLKLPDGDTLPGLITHYPPGGESHQDIAFIFKRDPTGGVIFKVDVTTSGNNKQQFVSSSYVSDQICGELKEEPAATPATKKPAVPATKRPA